MEWGHRAFQNLCCVVAILDYFFLPACSPCIAIHWTYFLYFCPSLYIRFNHLLTVLLSSFSYLATYSEMITLPLLLFALHKPFDFCVLEV